MNNPSTPKDLPICPQCQTTSDIGYKYCGKCGEKLRKVAHNFPWKPLLIFGGCVFVIGGLMLRRSVEGPPEIVDSAEMKNPVANTKAQQKELWEKGAAAKQQGRPNAARYFWNQALAVDPGNKGIEEAVEKLPKNLALKNPSEADIQNLTKLKVVKAVFSIEKVPKVVHSGPYCDASSWDFSSDVRNQIMAARWTVYVQNDLGEDVSAIAFRTKYSGKGRSVAREMGLKRYQDCGAPARFGLANVDNIKTKLPSGQTTKLILVDLVSVQAADLLKRGGGAIEIFVREKAESLAENPTGNTYPIPYKGYHGEGTESPTGTNAGTSDIDRYIAKLNAAPGASRFVDSVGVQYDDTAVVTMTSEFHGLEYHDRLKFAQILYNLWITVHCPNKPEKASLIMKASDGQHVGGTDMWKKLWVAN